MPEGTAPGLIRIDLNGLVAHRIIGNDLYPAYRHEDVALTAPLNPAAYEPDAVHGRECVVRLADGTELLRQITIQRNGRCTLIAYHAPPIFDAQVIAAEPVVGVWRAPAEAPSRFYI